MTTSRILLSARAVSAWSAMSVLAKLFVRHQQHPRHVQRDVAVADDHRTLGRQIERVAGVVGMAVVPGDEVGGRMTARSVLAGDGEVAAVDAPTA